MSTDITPQVIFLIVKDNPTKLQRLCDIVQEHFFKKDKIQIYVPNQEVANYIDQLLWRLPEESFIPHLIINNAIAEQVIITTQTPNLNHASVLVNLAPDVPGNIQGYKTIYELLDFTHPSKEELSRKRQHSYQSRGISFLEIS